MYTSHTNAPTTAVGEESKTTVKTITTEGVQVKTNIDIYIDSVHFLGTENDPDQLWVTIERVAGSGNDTYGGNFVLTQIEPVYVKWCSDSHLSSF